MKNITYKTNYSLDIWIHVWLKRQYGNPIKCEICKVQGKKEKRTWSIQWAVRQGKNYEKNRDNFIGLCRPCHFLYDITSKRLKSLKLSMKTNRINYGWDIKKGRR